MLLLFLRRYETFGLPAGPGMSARTFAATSNRGNTQAESSTGRTETATVIGRTGVTVGT